ncbi:lysine/arginine/ornithine ABC transporter substrate-binding protein [Methylopila sp. Yamaguchi]|uniref:lysine/arginine/ornithine ABC transporter substrate-binding protein n=1 Tax=Methylopila sp. Yamaguchi TaxID=1437817 RepID=UPI000CC1A09C|nr:lysine/arginine/ornithine ABC transporter substrate-binding protein [Methylopila sp. Yamaguchi]GBD48213.1 family 3 extracellular solute-binding protein [Methylopila sp. Yamaguchi]
MSSSRFAFAGAAALALACALIAGPAAAKDWSKLKIGTEGAYPPFNVVGADGQVQGFDIDIAKAICEKIKAECTFVAQDWDGIIPALLANKYDAIFASMSITDERKKTIAFSKRYYQTPALFVTDKRNASMGTSTDAMKGKTIGAQSSTVSGTYLQDVYEPAGATVKLYATQDEANLDLASGRLDAVLGDKTVMLPWLEKSEAGKCCQVIGQDIRDEKYFGEGIGAGLRKEDVELKELIDKGIAEILADGTYEKINAKYFPFSLY